MKHVLLIIGGLLLLSAGRAEYRKQECTNFVYRPEIGA